VLTPEGATQVKSLPDDAPPAVLYEPSYSAWPVGGGLFNVIENARSSNSEPTVARIVKLKPKDPMFGVVPLMTPLPLFKDPPVGNDPACNVYVIAAPLTEEAVTVKE
jgi:hypothetical protein